ncbi:hypothetical protein N431DRAFT_429848 [Stipitochalara longipes BDJ]|nr:hypothetical protein N431DRAFT_429848 [Stipitochalara longipes BDJ]
MAASALLYSPLSEEKREVRMLEVVSNTKIELGCSLHIVSLNEDAPFAAISYVWGDPNDTEPITVNGVVVFITKGLASAIRHIQKHLQNALPSRPQQSFRLWADALCINQSDFEERSQQVQLMRDIYRSAKVVFSWLGHKQDDVMALAMKTVEIVTDLPFQDMSSKDFASIRWLQDLDRLLSQDSSDEVEPDPNGQGLIWERRGGFQNKNWASIYRLFTLPYWSRLWVVQEVVLASNLLLACPSRTLPAVKLFDFTDRLYIFEKLFKSLSLGRPIFVSESTWMAVTGYIPSISIGFLKSTRIISQQARKDAITTGSHEENWLLSVMAARLKAKDPRDYIYGLLGISNCNIVPDYSPSKTLFEVYKDYVVAWLERKYNLGVNATDFPVLYFLRYAGARFPPNDLYHLPSWVPHYHEDNSFITPVHRAAGTQADRRLEYHDAIHVSNKSLFVGGFQYASISWLYDGPNPEAMYDGTMIKILNSILKHHQTSLPIGIPGLQAFLRLFRGDYEVEEKIKRIDILYAIGFLSILLRCACGSGRLRPEDVLPLLGLSAKAEEFTESFLDLLCPDFNLEENGIGQDLFEIMMLGDHGMLTEFMNRVVTDFFILDAHHRFARIRGPLGDHIALVNGSALEGDVVCILKGYDVPTLMRKVDDAWIYVGDCAFLGIMNGEAIDVLDNGLAAVETFEIR